MHDFSLGKSGFGFLVNSDGMIITHPNPDFVLQQSLHQTLDNSVVADQILNSDKGFLPDFKIKESQNISISYQLLANKKWKLVTIFSAIDLFENNREIKDKLVNLFISTSLFFIILLFIIIIAPKEVNTTSAWLYSYSITFILIFNIGFVWYLNLDNKYESHAKEDVIIVDKT